MQKIYDGKNIVDYSDLQLDDMAKKYNIDKNDLIKGNFFSNEPELKELRKKIVDKQDQSINENMKYTR